MRYGKIYEVNRRIYLNNSKSTQSAAKTYPRPPPKCARPKHLEAKRSGAPIMPQRLHHVARSQSVSFTPWCSGRVRHGVPAPACATNGHGFDSPHNGTVFVLFHFSVLCHFSVFIVKPGNARSICYSNNEVFMLPAPSQSAARVVSVSRSVQSAAVVASLTLSVKLLSSKSVTSVLARPDLAVLLDVSCPQAVPPPPPLPT